MEVLAAIRDFVIILVALAALTANVLLALVALKLWQLARELRTEVRPILHSVSSTASTVRGTTTLVGDVVVGPLARLAGLAAGTVTFMRAFVTLARGGAIRGARARGRRPRGGRRRA